MRSFFPNIARHKWMIDMVEQRQYREYIVMPHAQTIARLFQAVVINLHKTITHLHQQFSINALTEIRGERPFDAFACVVYLRVRHVEKTGKVCHLFKRKGLSLLALSKIVPEFVYLSCFIKISLDGYRNLV